jgi:hypothetical protein
MFSLDGTVGAFAVRAYDENGLMSFVSNTSKVRPEDVTDDDDDSDSIAGGMSSQDDLPGPHLDKGEDIGCGCD